MIAKAGALAGCLLLLAVNGWACDKTTYAGCSGTELRAIQQEQFQARKMQPRSASEYWRDRQYADRIRREEKNHELELERIRAEAAIEVARQERRSWRRGGYYFHRPPVTVKPVQPTAPAPPPKMRGQIYSNSRVNMVPRATKR